MRAGEIDAALLATPIQDANFIDVPLFFEPFLLAIPSDHWLVDRAEIGEAELREADLLLLNDGHCLREQALAICHSATKANGSANAAPNPNVSDVRATSLQTLMHMVAAGYGSTLLPALAVDQWRGMDNIKIRELKVANAGRRIAIVVRKSFPRMAAIKTVADAIRNALPDSVQVLSA